MMHLSNSTMRVVPDTNWYLFGLTFLQVILLSLAFWFGTMGLVALSGWPGWLALLIVLPTLSVMNWLHVTPFIKTSAAYLYVRWNLDTTITWEEARQLAPHLNRDIGAADVDAVKNKDKTD
jgi:hypothetical protein